MFDFDIGSRSIEIDFGSRKCEVFLRSVSGDECTRVIMSSNLINERSTGYLQVVFKDRYGYYETPSGICYSVFCLTNSQEIRSLTEVSAASTIEIVLTAEDNVILDPNNDIEERLVTIQANYDDGGECNQDFRYLVKNLYRV